MASPQQLQRQNLQNLH